MRVADFVIEYLLSKKIKTFFSVTGRGSLFLNDALAKSKKAKYFFFHHDSINFVDPVTHGQTYLFMK